MSVKELEERVLINKKQYLLIEKYIKDTFKDYTIIHQKNRYFDDEKKTIRANKNMLRIRSLKNSSIRELTYKIKGDNGDIECNQPLTYYWFRQILDNSRLPDGEVKSKLLEDNVDISSLKCLVDLRTRRTEVHLEDYTLVLDANMYNNIIDYDIEIESKISKMHAKEVILRLCEEFNLQYKNDYQVKSSRAFASIKN